MAASCGFDDLQNLLDMTSHESSLLYPCVYHMMKYRGEIRCGDHLAIKYGCVIVRLDFFAAKPTRKA